MGSGCVHEVDVAHIEERGHNIQLWEHLQQDLFLTPDCIAETIKRLLGPEVNTLYEKGKTDRAHARRNGLDDIRLDLLDVALIVSLRRAHSAGFRFGMSDGLRFRKLCPAVATNWDFIL